MDRTAGAQTAGTAKARGAAAAPGRTSPPSPSPAGASPRARGGGTSLAAGTGAGAAAWWWRGPGPRPAPTRARATAGAGPGTGSATAGGCRGSSWWRYRVEAATTENEPLSKLPAISVNLLISTIPYKAQRSLMCFVSTYFSVATLGLNN